jgi:DNA-binding FadR family transcriptional regulator
MPTTFRSTQVRVPKAGELVAAQLRRQIVTGELREGDALPPESALMEQFGISRPTLREAFRILESEHIIVIKRGARGGAHVLVPDAGAAGRYAGALLQYRGTTLSDLYEARTHLEAASVEMLARKRSAADLRRLDIAVSESEAALPDPVAYAEKHEIQFHRLLIELAGNQTMTVLLEMLLSISELHNQTFLRNHPLDDASEESARAAQRAHARLVELIRAKSADKAVALWRQHLRLVTEYMVSDPATTVLDVLS